MPWSRRLLTKMETLTKTEMVPGTMILMQQAWPGFCLEECGFDDFGLTYSNRHNHHRRWPLLVSRKDLKWRD